MGAASTHYDRENSVCFTTSRQSVRRERACRHRAVENTGQEAGWSSNAVIQCIKMVMVPRRLNWETDSLFKFLHMLTRWPSIVMVNFTRASITAVTVFTDTVRIVLSNAVRCQCIFPLFVPCLLLSQHIYKGEGHVIMSIKKNIQNSSRHLFSCMLHS